MVKFVIGAPEVSGNYNGVRSTAAFRQTKIPTNIKTVH